MKFEKVNPILEHLKKVIVKIALVAKKNAVSHVKYYTCLFCLI